MNNNGIAYNGSVKTIVYEHLTNGERDAIANIIHSYLRGADDYINNNVLVSMPDLAFDRVGITLCLDDIEHMDDINQRLENADKTILKYIESVKGAVEECKKDEKCKFMSNAEKIRAALDKVIANNEFSSNITIMGIRGKDPDKTPIIVVFPSTKKCVISPIDIKKLDKEFGKGNYKIAKISHKKYEKLCDKGMDPYEGVLF